MSQAPHFCCQGIYEQLNLAAEAFLEGDDGCQVDMNKKQVKLSQILKWYSVDFGKNKEEVCKHFCHKFHWVNIF